jgi:putative transcriptional regulator
MAKQVTKFNRLSVVLAELDVSQKELAERLNIERLATVSDWCKNKTQPSIPTLFDIANALAVDVRRLLEPNTSIDAAKNR